MKKRFLILFASILLFPFSGRACEACGCNLGGSYLGITPQFNQHFIGIRHLLSEYKGAVTHTDELLENEFSTDTYFKTELFGRFRIAERIQIGAFVPYQVNTRDGSDGKSTLSGFGDPSLIAYFQPFKPTSEKDWKHALLIGGGVKVPLGRYKAEEDGVPIHQNAQLGTGSTDLIFSANYTLRYKQLGLNAEQNLKINGTNKEDYQFGDQVSTSASFFYWIQNPYVAILPVAGLQYERAGRQYDGLVAERNSGGALTYLNLGVQLFHKSWGFNTSFQSPLYHTFNTEEGVTITPKNRFSFGITKSFGKSG